ncbi:hypothetical protein ACVDFE_15680 [Lentzea chajnantorensis]
MQSPDALTAVLVEADLLAREDSTIDELSRVLRDLAANAEHVDGLPAATARRFAPAVELLVERLLNSDEQAGALELIEEGLLDEVSALQAQLAQARTPAPGTPLPAGTPMSVTYHDDEVPVVIVVPAEAVPNSRTQALEVVRVAMSEFGPRELARIPELVTRAPRWLHDSSTVLAECVSLLTATTGIPLPTGIVAVGRWSGSEFAPLSKDEISKHHDAVKADGRFNALLVPTTTGWLLRTADHERTTDDNQRGLAGLAAFLFENAWANWRRERFAAVLADCKWRKADVTPKNDPLPEIRTQQSQIVKQMLWRDEVPVVLFGGGTKCGKRVTVTQVTTQMTALNWQCVTLNTDSDQELTTRDELIRVGRAAFACEPERKYQRRLLVLMGMRPVSNSGDIADILRDVAQKLEVSIFALPQFESGPGAEWTTGGCPVVHAISGPEQSLDFAESLRKSLPDLLGELTDDQLRDIAQRNDANLRDLCDELLRVARGEDEDVEDNSGVFARLTGDQRETLAIAATRVILKRPTPQDELTDFLDVDELPQLGFSPTAVPGYLTLNNVSAGERILLACDQLAGAADPARPRAEAGEAAITRYSAAELRRAARSDDKPTRNTIPTAIFSLRMYGPVLARRVIEEFAESDEFKLWLTAAGSDEIAALLRSSGGLFGKRVDELCELLASRISGLQIDLRQSTLMMVAGVVSRYRTSIDGDLFGHCLSWVRNAAEHALRIGYASKHDTYGLLNLLLRFNDPKIDEIVIEGARELLTGLDHTSLMECLLVYRVDQLATRAINRSEHPDRHEAIGEHPEVRRLLGIPPSDASFTLTLLRLALWVHFDKPDEDWTERLHAAKPALLRALAGESARDVHLVLSQIGEIRVVFANRVLNELTSFSDEISKIIRSSTPPADTAMLLNTTRRLHLNRAIQVLYPRGGYEPDVELAEDLAEIARKQRDGKGTGMLLAALTAIDENVLREHAGFGTLVAEDLGFDWVVERIRLDTRSSTRYHLLKEIWGTEASYRKQLVEIALNVIVHAVNRGVSHWGPQLALRLGEHADLGWDFLRSLQGRLWDEGVFNGMIGMQNAQAQMHYHRLGRALFPHLIGRFIEAFNEMPSQYMQGISTSEATVACAAAAETLIAGGVTDAGKDVLNVVLGDAEDIEKRLRNIYNAAELATAMHNLAHLDRTVARTVVTALAQPEAVETDDEDTASAQPAQLTLLARRARQAMYDSPLAGLDFLNAAERAAEGTGAQLLNDTRGRHVWRTFFREALHLQDPIEQYRATRYLTQLGWLPTASNKESATGLYRKWLESQSLQGITCVKRLTGLLRMFLTWSEAVPGQRDWPWKIAMKINFEAVQRRLERCRPADLAALPLFAESLVLTRKRDEAKKLVDLVVGLGRDTVADRLSLWDLYRLHDCATRLQVPGAAWVTDQLAAQVSAGIEKSIIYNEREHWYEIGWAVHRLRVSNAPVPEITRTELNPNMAHPFLMGWALSALPSSKWLDRELDRVRSLVHGVAPVTDQDRFCAIVMGARLGDVAAFVDVTDADVKNSVARTSFHRLRALQEIAQGSPEVAQLLDDVEPEIRIRARKPLALCEISAQDVVINFKRT